MYYNSLDEAPSHAALLMDIAWLTSTYILDVKHITSSGYYNTVIHLYHQFITSAISIPWTFLTNIWKYAFLEKATGTCVTSFNVTR